MSDRLPLKQNSPGQGLLLTTLAMLALGVVVVHSAVASVADRGFSWYNRTDVRHTIFATAAALLLLLLWRFDYRRLVKDKGIPWIPLLLLLFGMLTAAAIITPGLKNVVGFAVGGKWRWFRLGPPKFSIGFQPSEIIKFTLPLFLAAWLTRPGVNPRSFFKSFIPAMALIGACLGLTIKNDLGTSLIIGTCSIVTMIFAGVPWYYFLLFTPGGWFGFKAIKANPEKWARIEAWMDPWNVDNPSTYQGRQSLLAILTGGWFGKGVGNGEIKLGYLPEDTTDFIFAVFCEEWGFVGAILLMGLIIAWIWHTRRAALRASDKFGRVLAGSMGFVVALQAVFHIGVDLQVLPPTGMTLPFISAGGTGLMLLAAAVAMIVSVSSYASPGGQITLDASPLAAESGGKK